MSRISQEDLEKLKIPRGRKVSPLGVLLRNIKPGESEMVDTTTSDIKNVLSSYSIARGLGKRVTINKVSETTFVITCISATTL